VASRFPENLQPSAVGSEGAIPDTVFAIDGETLIPSRVGFRETILKFKFSSRYSLFFKQPILGIDVLNSLQGSHPLARRFLQYNAGFDGPDELQNTHPVRNIGLRRAIPDQVHIQLYPSMVGSESESAIPDAVFAIEGETLFPSRVGCRFHTGSSQESDREFGDLH
jgi:hypothetical protein